MGDPAVKKDLVTQVSTSQQGVLCCVLSQEDLVPLRGSIKGGNVGGREAHCELVLAEFLHIKPRGKRCFEDDILLLKHCHRFSWRRKKL
jgi:hypothetical protein